MKASLKWILDYIPGLSIKDYNEFFQKLIDTGLDIESVEFQRDKFRNFVVGKVIETKKHPNAEKLTQCKVDIGEKVLDIVCGAPNVNYGQKVCVAKLGAIIPKGGFEIKKSKIRGEISEGMICAEDELEISDDHSGIMILNEDAEIGMSFADYIGADDIILEIGITPNRGDLFSHIGLAREIAAVTGYKLIIPENNISESNENSEDYCKVEIKRKDFCKRFTGRVIRNVDIKESPQWLKNYLTSVGLRPRNNVVDITNFVMLETGQPLHAFDYDKIRGRKIIVDTANEGDKFVTLDSKERVLNENSLMICDANGYTAIAGIMGGEFSEITNETRNVFLECAFFDPVCIRKNSKKLGIQTDASQRFERGVDIENLKYVSDRASFLIQKYANGEVLKGIIDVYADKYPENKVILRNSRVAKVIGKIIPDNEIIKSLENIGFKLIKEEKGTFEFLVPEFRRHDVTREIDLIEEVARMYGYSRIEAKSDFRVNLSSLMSYNDDYEKFIRIIREYFVGRGFHEILSYSQLESNFLSRYSDDFIKIENPNSSEMDSMRNNMFISMLSSVKNNINFSGKDISLKLFEIGKTFLNDPVIESEKLCFSIYGIAEKDLGKYRFFDYFDAKGEIEMLLMKLNLENYGFNYYNTEKYVGITVENKTIGKMINPGNALLKDLDLDLNVYVAEFDIKTIFELSEKKREFKEYSKFPPIKRDLALVMDKNVRYDEVVEVIRDKSGKYIRNLSLFDFYEDEKIGKDKKSLAFSLEFSSDERTLKDDEVNLVLDRIIQALDKKYGIKIRNF